MNSQGLVLGEFLPLSRLCHRSPELPWPKLRYPETAGDTTEPVHNGDKDQAELERNGPAAPSFSVPRKAQASS